MLFVISKLSEIGADPGNVLAALLVIGVVLLWRGRARAGRRFVTAVAVAFIVVAILPLGSWAIAPLEARFPRVHLPPQIYGIILLGGAIDVANTVAHGEVALNDAAERITETVALARLYPAAAVLITGGNAAIIPGRFTEATAMRRLLIVEGVAPERLLIEDRSRNTIENAIYSKDVAQPQADQTWLMVTSAFHMPRAVGCFRHVGWEVIPVPVDYRSGAPLPIVIPSVTGHLHLIGLALHEWAGLVAYRVLGRIDSLFPAPISSSSAR
jgi:uncharacterized SAM-binding protein YcdF (DUF218 family)